MGLMSFDEYRAVRSESSPATRNKLAASLGLQPMYSADVFGHSTPPPNVADKLLKKLGKKKKVNEHKGKNPDRSIDNFIKKADKASKEIEDTENDTNKKEKDLDVKINKKKEDAKKIKSKSQQDKDEIDDDDSKEWGNIFNAMTKKNTDFEDNEEDEVKKKK